MLRSLALAALVALSLGHCTAAAASPTEDSLASAFSPPLYPPVLLEFGASSFTDSDSELAELVHPALSRESDLIAANERLLASAELLAHSLGAPVFSERLAEKDEHDVQAVERSLIASEAHAAPRSEVELLLSSPDGAASQLPTALLESAPTLPSDALAHDEDVLSMVELSSSLRDGPAPAGSEGKKAADPYALADPLASEGQRLKNLKGLDIYVVNAEAPNASDNDNELRPVKPPHPMSASLRAKARLAALMKKNLVHDVPQPRASVKPKTPLNTLSAYESSLLPAKPLKGRLQRSLRDPIVGGQGARQLSSAVASKRFVGLEVQQDVALPGTDASASLPAFPADPTAKAATPIRAFGAESSFDNRDGPPRLLSDLLPIKAVLVEDLDPLGQNAAKEESKPNWGAN